LAACALRDCLHREAHLTGAPRVVG
jgi:hypothetical protein